MNTRTRDLRVVLYSDAQGRHRWRCIAGNGRILSKSARSFGTRSQARNDIDFMATQHPEAMFYRDRSGQWRWRCLCGCRIMSVSTEAYHNREDCVESANLFLKATLK